jgi:hypothetical protein
VAILAGFGSGKGAGRDAEEQCHKDKKSGYVQDARAAVNKEGSHYLIRA